MRSLVTAAIRMLHAPVRAGRRQSWIEQKVRKGDAHPCALIDRFVTDAVAASVPMDQTLGIARAMEHAIYRAYDAVPDATDYDTANLSETRAEGALNPYQVRRFASLDARERMELEALADADARESARYALAVRVANHRTDLAIDAAHARLLGTLRPA